MGVIWLLLVHFQSHMKHHMWPSSIEHNCAPVRYCWFLVLLAVLEFLLYKSERSVAPLLSLLQGRSKLQKLQADCKKVGRSFCFFRGPERVKLMRRWLAVLKEVEKLFTSNDKDKDNEQHQLLEEQKIPRKQYMALDHHGIMCIEDIVNEIATVGPHFKKVSNFLCPFNLNKPEKALQGKKQRFKDGGDSGNQEDQINELISKMN